MSPKDDERRLRENVEEGLGRSMTESEWSRLLEASSVAPAPQKPSSPASDAWSRSDLAFPWPDLPVTLFISAVVGALALGLAWAFGTLDDKTPAEVFGGWAILAMILFNGIWGWGAAERFFRSLAAPVISGSFIVLVIAAIVKAV